MFLSKTEIVLYSTLAIGVFAGHMLGFPAGYLVAFAVLIAAADMKLSRRSRTRPELREVRWPWRRAAFWIVLGLIALAAGILSASGASIGLVALVCGIALAIYAYDVARQVQLVRGKRGASKSRIGPSLEDWALLATSLGFCILALFLIGRDWRTAIVTLTFFGACALVFASNILRKRRERNWRGALVQVVGGVNIYAQGASMMPIAIGCVVVGSVCYFVGRDYPLFFRLLGVFIALVGVGVGIALALGYYRRQSLRFDADAITFGERNYRCRVTWDNVLDVMSIEFADNPFVGLRLRNPERVEVDPPDQTEAFSRSIGNNNALMGSDLLVAPRHFGIDGSILAAALARYAADPTAREELRFRNRPLLAR